MSRGSQRRTSASWPRPLPESAALALLGTARYFLMFLPPYDRRASFSELARVVKPGGYLVTAMNPAEPWS